MGAFGDKVCHVFADERDAWKWERRTAEGVDAPNGGQEKVFVVSNNKCGTTSMAGYFHSIGMDVAPQAIAEDLARDWNGLLDHPGGSSKKAWETYIDSHEVFQDVPFSRASWLPRLILTYPSARYVYVQRDADSWYTSLVNHHFIRVFGVKPMFDHRGSVIWSHELTQRADVRRYRGGDLSKGATLRFGTTHTNPYDRATLIDYHNRHMAQAKRLLPQVDSIMLSVDELSTPESGERMAEFLHLPEVVPMPRLNMADDLSRR